ncbi:MAG: hypothetical protein A2X67_10240 [Ignavibacteria bacterium GWA2_55_11]|nr:MAG: hypothetical protein A2X67_10240 [Ignavibacteria bacterium GWA2_55_11]OGU44583.1 MAG: hypothetical protein A2X68_13225 [Ignavibacteria bacterium GWC2_56_12]OGU66292.1 MAG: hypothetical protein A3C56_09930 [Ignavibacteria bacterium RIFCSPHIGHO2_02_FULL_56_12]OGU70981.1 MAG: hypothetical protein A3H45_12575 [Ignavibacteria bacterium RIFCSPLOWO2_02_FULL_55_14]
MKRNTRIEGEAVNFQVLVKSYSVEAPLIIQFRLINLIPSSYPSDRREIGEIHTASIFYSFNI